MNLWKLLNNLVQSVIVWIKKSTHSKVDAPERVFSPYGLASPVGRQERHFYFFLFLLSRKARNVITKLPKDISKPIIPININMISAAFITTHLPSLRNRHAQTSCTCRVVHPLIKRKRLMFWYALNYYVSMHHTTSIHLYVQTIPV